MTDGGLSLRLCQPSTVNCQLFVFGLFYSCLVLRRIAANERILLEIHYLPADRPALITQQKNSGSGNFTGYLKAVHQSQLPAQRRHDPLSVYVDALEDQFGD